MPTARIIECPECGHRAEMRQADGLEFRTWGPQVVRRPPPPPQVCCGNRECRHYVRGFEVL